jgi:hypothetical protein
MGDSEDVEFIKSHLTIARWHLERASNPDRDGEHEHDHLDEARRAYEMAVELLPTLGVSGRKRVELITELAALRDQLRTAGENV